MQTIDLAPRQANDKDYYAKKKLLQVVLQIKRERTKTSGIFLKLKPRN